MAEQAEHIGGAFDDVAAGAVDALHSGFAQVFIILRRDDAAGDDLDVASAGFAQPGDEFGDQGLVAGRQAGGTDYVDAGVERDHDGSSGVWNSGPLITSKPMSPNALAMTLAPRSWPS